MELRLEKNPILAVCPNPAWQRTLIFDKLQAGGVNRAESVSQCGGGKGVNVARVLRKLGFPVTVAAFVGGDTGKSLTEELKRNGAGDLTLFCQAATRCCYTVVDKENGQATELIEPSPTIQANEVAELLELLSGKITRFSAICLTGSTPAGIGPEFYAQIAAMAGTAAIPVLLDACRDIRPTLDTGAIRILKINAAETREFSGEEELPVAAAKILSSFPVPWLAVTDGPGAAWLFSSRQTWRFTIPALPAIVSPIGAGDCAAAILTRHLAENQALEEMPAFFAEALACASASCLTAYPALFDPVEAEKIRAGICIDSQVPASYKEQCL
jgi:tagatose 6-phosphate kinase